MDSLSHAARVLAATNEPAGINTLLGWLGFADAPLALDADMHERLGIPPQILEATVASASGALRSLNVVLASDSDLRSCITTIARRLTTTAPQFYWLIVATQRNSSLLAIAAWRTIKQVPRVAAIITDRDHVLESDLETLCTLAAAGSAPNGAMRHARWIDVLGRDSVTRRFFVALAGAVSTLATSFPDSVPIADRREISILTASRLLFLSFLETKGWLNRDFGFLANGFAECMATGGGYQRRVLEPLFFGTLNTRIRERASRARAFGDIPFLNGGLFARTTVERIHRHSRATDDALGALFGDVLVRYRFTAHEDSTNWSQTAIDPEILGKVFESLMHTSDRKRDGVFYTPQQFVERLASLALAANLHRHGLAQRTIDALLGEDVDQIAPDPALLDYLKRIRILDPACGSGAFLVHVLERLARLRTVLGDSTPSSEIRRSVLTQSIFGVDSSPTAVWLCQLRLWLSTVIDREEDSPLKVRPLPNLDRQIRIGDSLAGGAFAPGATLDVVSRRLATIRRRYVQATGRRKEALRRRLDLIERANAITGIERAIAMARFERREIVAMLRSKDLFDKRHAPNSAQRQRLVELRALLRMLARRRSVIHRGGTPSFAYPTHFADVAAAGGFDLVVGNPPWVRLHNISADLRTQYREKFSVYRASAWAEGARGARAGAGFAAQVDLAALFVERSTGLLTTNGTLGLLVPSKLWCSLAGGGARQFLLARTEIDAIEDWADAPAAFDAAAYPSMLVATRAERSTDHRIRLTVHRGNDSHQWTAASRALALDTSPGSPWLLIPRSVRTAFDQLTAAGVPLFESVLRRPHLGVKTGSNEVFIVRVDADAENAGNTRIHGGRHTGMIESCLLRPLVRGETLGPWRLLPNDERIIWTHGADGAPLGVLPPNASRWLARSRQALERRSDSRSDRWWSLFRVESARNVTARVVWCDFGRTPRAAVIDAGDPTVPLNTCYAISCHRPDDALAFCAILNSNVAAAWLAVLAEPARGGYHRYLGWTVARLPIPIDWPRARQLLAPIGERARAGAPPTSTALNDAVLDAYALPRRSMTDLLEWMNAGDD